VVAGLPVVVGGEYVNRVLSDDERSDQGLPVGLRKGQQLQQEQPQLEQQQHLVPQLQHVKSPGGFDLASPDSVSSDNSVANPMYRQKPLVYPEQTTQIQPGSGRNSGNPVDTRAGDTNSRMQMQQVHDPGYMVQSHFDQYQQLHQPQQYIPSGAPYIQHHPPGTMPVYYSVYPPQQHGGNPPGVEQHPYPFYYMPTRQQPQMYSMPPQQPNYSETPQTVPSSRTQTPPLASVTSYNPATSAAKPDMGAAGVYRTSAAPPPTQVQQVPTSQPSPLYAGFSQVYHPQQGMAPSGATTNYGYESGDPSHPQVYYTTQPHAPQVAAQYQTMAPTPAAATLSDAPPPLQQLSTENIKQPVRTQP
jgi:hypothetical protein